MCYLSYILNLLVYFIVFLLILILLVRVLGRANIKKVDDYYQKTWNNQVEMISLLKEIRDLLKK